MTIKYPDCPLCRKKGWIIKEVITRDEDFFAVSNSRTRPPLDEPGHYDEVVPCNCHYGTMYAEWRRKTQHPEYKNPLLEMSDEEILKLLSESSENQRAVDAEFR